MNATIKTSAIALALAATVGLAGTATAQDAAGTPKLVIQETTYAAGDVPKGTAVEHDFVVKNEGDADLLILNVKPACGCTTPGYDKVIPPGGEGKISLKVDTARFKGSISKSASVQTNDPTQPNLRLVMNANVKTFIDVLPRDVVTFRQYRGEAKKDELTIRSNEEGDFEIKDVKVVGDHINHELNEKEDDEYALTVWVDEDAPVGNLAGSLKLLTSSKKEPEVTVNVRGTILGQISVNPSTLYFRVDSSTSEVQAITDNLNVRSRGELSADVVSQIGKDETMKVVDRVDDWTKVRLPSGTEGWVYNKLVKSAESDAAKQSKVLNITHRKQSSFNIEGTEVQGANLSSDLLDVDTESVRDGQSYRVTVTYGGGLDAGNYTGSLILRTTDPQEPEITIPLYIVVT